MDLAYIKQNEKLLEKHRHWNVEHIDWWDSTYEMFREDMQEQGIDVERMYFSGFWSQGDGACFEGHIEDTIMFLDKNCKPEEYPMIRMVVANGGRVRLSVRQSGHYYHENCTAFSMDADMPSNVMEQRTEFHEQVVEGYDKVMEKEIDDFEKESIEIFKNFMRKLYRNLEQEYDYLTSDDAVAEAIQANDLTDDEGDE
jgi:hypothetical protein